MGGQEHGCCGCCRGGELELTAAELALLRRLATLPFLPLARRADAETPVCLEADTAAILGLAQKQLVRLDYDMPLVNFDYAGYAAYPCRGSMALTARGQTVLDLLDIQGIEA